MNNRLNLLLSGHALTLNQQMAVAEITRGQRGGRAIAAEQMAQHDPSDAAEELKEKQAEAKRREQIRRRKDRNKAAKRAAKKQTAPPVFLGVMRDTKALANKALVDFSRGPEWDRQAQLIRAARAQPCE